MIAEDGTLHLTQQEHNELIALCSKILGNKDNRVPLPIFTNVIQALAGEKPYCERCNNFGGGD